MCLPLSKTVMVNLPGVSEKGSFDSIAKKVECGELGPQMRSKAVRGAYLTAETRILSFHVSESQPELQARLAEGRHAK
jgi:hypothetical protein